MKRFAYILCLFFIFSTSVQAARKDTIPTIIRSWQLENGLAIADSVAPDTAWRNYAQLNINNKYSIANTWNGNLISPIQTQLYFLRTKHSDFLFGQAYIPYLIEPKDIRYYNTTTPYSNISYRKGFTTYREENDLSFHFTGNFNKQTNLGISLDYKNSVGLYANQAGKRFNGAIWASYNGNRYSCHGSVMFNNLQNFENGGIKDIEEYMSSELYTYDYPYILSGMSWIKTYSMFFNQRYSICIEKQKEIAPDSIVTEYIPVTTFLHTIEINRATKRYMEKTNDTTIWQHSYYDKAYTHDSTNLLRIDNTLAVTFEEAFNKWLKFGAIVYADYEAERYGNIVTDIDTARYIDTSAWHHNIKVGGRLFKKQGRWIHYDFGGDIYLLGYKLGEFSVDGKLEGIIPAGKDSLQIAAKVRFNNEQPNFFLQNYRSNHFVWNNNFQKTYIFRVGGEVVYPSKWITLKANAHFENITRLIYFDTYGLPQQQDKNVQVVAVGAVANVHTKRFGWENEVVWQHSSSECLPLPDVALYTNIYYHDVWAKVLHVQWGVDLRYNTAYYAPLLNPATGQFCMQDIQKIGNYPIMSVYANFKLKKAKFFAQFTHFNKYFWPNHEYYSMVNYPKNPPVFSAGVSWNFFD